jgi:hypothetical protein
MTVPATATGPNGPNGPNGLNGPAKPTDHAIQLPVRLYTDVDSMMAFCEQHEIWLISVDAMRPWHQEVLLVLNGPVSFQHVPSLLVKRHVGLVDDADDVQSKEPSSRRGDTEVEDTCQGIMDEHGMTVTEHMDMMDVMQPAVPSNKKKILRSAAAAAVTTTAVDTAAAVTTAAAVDATDTSKANEHRRAIRFENLDDMTAFLRGHYAFWHTLWKIKRAGKYVAGKHTRDIEYLTPLWTIWKSLVHYGGVTVPATMQDHQLQELRALPTLHIARSTEMQTLLSHRNILHDILRVAEVAQLKQVKEYACMLAASASPTLPARGAKKKMSAHKSSTHKSAIVTYGAIKPNQLYKMPKEEWTEAVMNAFFERPDRDYSVEPVLVKISHFQRNGPGRNFRLLCHWKNGASTWQKYTHLFPNPTYREYLKRNEWEVEEECKYDKEQCQGKLGEAELSDGAVEDLLEYKEFHERLKQQKQEDSDDEHELLHGFRKTSKRKKPTAHADANPRSAKIRKHLNGYPMCVFRSSRHRFRRDVAASEQEPGDYED